MTLIVGTITKDHAIHVSDRRLTSSEGGLVTEESNKAILFTSPVWRFIAGYSGLAGYNGFRTGQWLRDALKQSLLPGIDMPGPFERLTGVATTTFSRFPLGSLRPELKRLTIMFTGFDRLASGSRPMWAFVTNFQNFESGVDSAEAWDAFRISYGLPVEMPCNPRSVQRIGQYQEFGDQEVTEIKELLAKGSPPEGIVRKLVSTVREISDRPGASGTVGKQLMSAVLPADFEEAPKFAYHSEGPSASYYGPDIVAAGPHGPYVIGDLELRANNGEPFPHPKQPRNQRCGCGSGKKYKHCHGT